MKKHAKPMLARHSRIKNRLVLKTENFTERDVPDLLKAVRGCIPFSNSAPSKLTTQSRKKITKLIDRGNFSSISNTCHKLEIKNSLLMQAKQELEASLEIYKDLYDFAPVGYFTIDSKGTIKKVNLAGSALVSTMRARLLGSQFASLLLASSRDRFRALLKRLFLQQNRQVGVFSLNDQNGTSRFIRIRAQLSPDRRECHAVMVDITDRQVADEKVRTSEIRYRRLFESTQDGILLLNAQTRKIIDANPFITKLLGYTQSQLLGKELYEIGLVNDKKTSQKLFRDLKHEQELRYDHLPLKNKNGNHHEVEVVANLYQENGRSVMQLNVRDISIRRQAERILKQNQTLFSKLIEQAPFGVYVVDNKFRLQQVNRKALPIFRKIRPLLGRSFFKINQQLWPTKIAKQIAKQFRQTMLTGKMFHNAEFTCVRRDTKMEEAYDWQIQRITMPSGEHGIVVFFTDITERKRLEKIQNRLAIISASNRRLEAEVIQRVAAEKSLKKSQAKQHKLLLQSERMQDQLRHLSRQVLRAQEDERKRISRELHDVIAQTLTGINLRLAALKQQAGVNNQDFNRHISQTQQLVEKSVNSVQQFARELRPAVLDDLGLFPALHTFLKHFTETTGIRTHLSNIVRLEKLDTAQRTALFRVAQEALTNVARHANATHVFIKLRKTSTGTEIKICDNGKSFKVKDVLIVPGGKHLGLLGMRERMEMVGGRLAIESFQGKGTTICAQIPFLKKSPTPASMQRT
jgi:PAS domain S-box-containing protein